MKKTIFGFLVAVVAAIAPISSWAIEMKTLSSKVSGFACTVPEAAIVHTDNNETCTFITPDQGFIISAIPVEGGQLSEQMINTVVTALAETVELDFAKSDTIDFKNDSMEGVVYVQEKESTSKAGVGLIGLAEGNRGFFVTVYANNLYLDVFDEVLNSAKYDGTVVEVKAPVKKQATKPKRHRR